MIYYKHPKTGEIFGYESPADRDKFGAKELTPLSAQEVDALLNPVFPVSVILERAKSELRAMREPMLSAVTGIGWDASEAGDVALAQEARNIRNALRDITADPALNAAETYAEMRAAGVAAYRRIAAGASPAFAATFKEFTGA